MSDEESLDEESLANALSDADDEAAAASDGFGRDSAESDSARLSAAADSLDADDYFGALPSEHASPEAQRQYHAARLAAVVQQHDTRGLLACLRRAPDCAALRLFYPNAHVLGVRLCLAQVFCFFLLLKVS